MRKGINARHVIGMSALAAGVWASTQLHATPAPQSTNQCTVSVDDPIPGRRDAVEIVAKYTEPIGDSLTARFPQDARIEVIKARRGDIQLTALLTLNTMQAVEGEWDLTITGQNGECSGKVNVGRL